MKKRKKRIGWIVSVLLLLILFVFAVKPACPLLLFPKACTYTQRAILSYDDGIEYERTWPMTQEEMRALSGVLRGKWFMRKDLTEAGGFSFSPEHVFVFRFPFGITQTFSYDDFKYHLAKMAFPGSFRALTDEEQAHIHEIIKSIAEDNSRTPAYALITEENTKAKIVFDADGILVLQKESGYDVLFGDLWGVPDKIIFDEFGTLLSDETKSTIRAEKATDEVIGSIFTETDMISALGEPLAGIGSHVKMAIYITDDGRILYLMLTGEHVGIYDLIDITDLKE